MTAAHRTVLARFRRGFRASEGWRWNEARGSRIGGEDYWGPYTRLQYASRASIYFPLTVDHAHIVPGTVRNFRPRAEELQQCLDDNQVPIGPELCNSQQPQGEYVIGPEHADAVIEVLRNG